MSNKLNSNTESDSDIAKKIQATSFGLLNNKDWQKFWSEKQRRIRGKSLLNFEIESIEELDDDTVLTQQIDIFDEHLVSEDIIRQKEDEIALQKMEALKDLIDRTVEQAMSGHCEEDNIRIITLPSFADECMTFLLPRDQRDEIMGDLEEDYRVNIVPKLGEKLAKRWYWFQAIRTIWHYNGLTARIIRLVEGIRNSGK
jgi:hypothetical protein